MRRGSAFWWIIAGFGVAGLLIVWSWARSGNAIKGIFDSMDRERHLELLPAPLDPGDTVLVSTLQTPLATGTNCFYSPCFQAAWNRLLEVKRVVPGGNAAVPLLAELDRQLVSPDDMPMEDIFVSFDAMTEGVAAVNAAKYANLFGEQPSWQPVVAGPDSFSLIGAINNRLRFGKAYERFEHAVSFNGSDRYQGFGYRMGRVGDAALRQTHVLFYEKGEIFGVELSTTSSASIILAQVPRGATLLATIEDVASRTATASGTRGTCPDNFTVPLVSCRTRDHGGEIVGKPIVIDGRPGSVGQAENELLFRLNEFGTDTVGMIRVVSYLSAAMDPIDCHFSQPFLIMLRKRDRQMPFFAAWIENDKVLHRF